MENLKTEGAKNAVQTMLFYYISSLIGTVEDPKQYIANQISEMIDLSEEQANYVKLNLALENKLLDNLKSSIQLLDKKKKKKTLDLDSIKIVKGILNIMYDNSIKIIDTENDE